jgi:acyl-CoA reductase-like NAD-dependent aldehyde dehydrogenase
MPETETARARDGQQLSGRWSSRRQWRPDGDGGGGARRWRTQLDPGTGKPFAEVLDLTPAEATVRLEQIRASYRPDRLPSAAERAELLLTMARLVEDHADDLGELDALCTGKLRSHATGTAQAGAAILRYYAGLLDEDTYSAELPSEQPGARQFVDRLPVGLAACILPWNVPLSQGCARLAMLFAAGCAGVFKGSELAQPPLLALAELASEAGLPPWAFSVLTGGPEIGQLLTESPLVDAICFTGGISTGIAVAQAAARSLKRVILELGGKTPFVVFADADLDSALYVALSAGFGFQGQACNAGSLLMVEESVYPDFAARFAAQAAGLRIGYQLDTDTEVGPMISAAQRTRVGSLVDAALTSGARLRAGGSATAVDSGGFFYRPTVLSDVPAGTPMATDEIFGPVVSVRSFTTEDEVISTVNNSPYGLAATVWTTSEERVDRMRASLRTGQLYVNTHGQVPRNTPWGGFRLSGMGRLYGRDGLFAFTEARQTYELGFS